MARWCLDGSWDKLKVARDDLGTALALETLRETKHRLYRNNEYMGHEYEKLLDRFAPGKRCWFITGDDFDPRKPSLETSGSLTALAVIAIERIVSDVRVPDAAGLV